MTVSIPPSWAAVLPPVVLIPLLACTSSTPPPADPAPAPQAPAALSAADHAALATKLCGDAPGCSLVAAHPAGKGPAGEGLTVLELKIPNAAESADGEYVEQCRPHRQRFYRVVQDGGRVQTELLMDLCNDGYGAAGLGEDYVKVGDNTLLHSQSGGSNSRWEFTRTYRLLPLSLLSDDSCSYHAAAGNAQSVKTDWANLRAISRWDANDCGAQTEVAYTCDTPNLRYQYDLVPQLDPEGPLPTDWRKTALGTCAFTMDASGKAGYITHGQPGAASDASMKVLLADKKTIVIEITDDQWVSGAASWLYDDHVELWMGDDMQAGFCIDGKGQTSQWGIRVADGAVFVGRGKRSWQPTVQRVEFDAGGGKKGTRLILTLGDELEAFTVVYSDSDDGKTQERLMATSRLKFANAASLGYSIQAGPFAGGCRMGPALTWEAKPISIEGDGPALDNL